MIQTRVAAVLDWYVFFTCFLVPADLLSLSRSPASSDTSMFCEWSLARAHNMTPSPLGRRLRTACIGKG